MKKLWEELSTLNTKSQCTCDCVCGAKANFHKAEQDRRLIQFLMGLNEEYTIIRGSILMVNPLPSVAQAFSFLVQDEQQREIKPFNHLTMESTALHVTSSRSPNYKTNYLASSQSGSLQYKDKFYEYCKRTGHFKEKCFLLHGYPPNSNLPNHNQNSIQHPNGNYNRPNQNQIHYTQRNNNFQSSTPRPNTSRNPYNYNHQAHIPAQRYGKGNGNRPVAHVYCTSESNSKKGTIDDQEEIYNLSLTKDQYGRVQNMLQLFQKDHNNDGSVDFTTSTIDFAGPFNEEFSGDW
ncbi:hypothetical protein P3S68_002175 [Capsicum galapagoense]